MAAGKELRRIRIATGMSAQELADQIGIDPERLRKWEQKDSNPRSSDREKIEDFFGVDLEELPNIQKVPKRTKKQKAEIIPVGKVAHVRHNPDAFSDWVGLPMYNAPVTASFVATYRDEASYTPQYYLHDPRFRDCNFGAIITGDSMHSEIRHGDFVICQEITDPSFVVYGDIYYVVASNGLETCKYLNADPNNPDNFLLCARNERISPSPIPKSKILKLFKVRGIVRGY